MSNDNFKREGWTPTLVPEPTRYRPGDRSDGWARGPFGICEHAFVHEDAGPARVAFLYHRKTGFRLAGFMDAETAADAAEILEPLADWDAVLAPAKTRIQAQEIMGWYVRDRWSHFIAFEWFFDGNPVLTVVA